MSKTTEEVILPVLKQMADFVQFKSWAAHVRTQLKLVQQFGAPSKFTMLPGSVVWVEADEPDTYHLARVIQYSTSSVLHDVDVGYLETGLVGRVPVENLHFTPTPPNYSEAFVKSVERQLADFSTQAARKTRKTRRTVSRTPR